MCFSCSYHSKYQKSITPPFQCFFWQCVLFLKVIYFPYLFFISWHLRRIKSTLVIWHILGKPYCYYTHPDDQTTLLHATSGFKPFTVLRSLGRQSERLANDYITYVSTVRRIRQQLWFNHRCKDHGLVPAGLKLKSPLNTQEAIQIVKATRRRLLKARINDCLRRLKRNTDKRQQLHDKLNQLIPTELLDTITTIAYRRANKATERARTGHQQKLTRLLRSKEQRRSKPDDNWVRNISSRPLDTNETRVLL